MLRRPRDDDWTGMLGIAERTDERGDDRRPWASRWWIAAAVFIAAVIIALGGRLLFLDPDEPGPAPPPAPAPAAIGCEDRPDAIAPPTDGGAHAWTRIGLVMAPEHPDVGPHADLEGLRACYSAGPAGALFAATNFAASLTDSRLIDRVHELMAPSVGRDAWVAKSPPHGATPYEFIAYGFDSESPQRVDVSLVILRADQATARLSITVVRQDNTWLVVPPPNAEFPARGGVNTVGHTPWSASG